MDFSKYFSRLILLPFGVLKGVFDIGNEIARDFANKRIYPQAFIEKGCCMTADTVIGQNSHIYNNSVLNHSKIGSYTYISNNCLIQNAIIGNYCSISSDVIIGLGSHPLTHFSTSPIFYKSINSLKIKLIENDLGFDEYKEIVIGSDVWIGARVIIMDGVEIGVGAVLAAGAVITKNVPPFAVVGGVPAKIIKYRFPEETREQLLNIQWWKKNPEEVFSIRESLINICNESPFNNIP